MNRSHRALVLVVAMALAWSAGASSGARAATGPGGSVTSRQAAALARQAETSDTALARLRAVRRIDGRSVDLVAATRGLRGRARRLRLELLAASLAGRGGAAASSNPAASARRTAHQVVTGRKYRPRSVPKPFRGVTRWVGDRLEPITRALDHVPGGDLFLLLLAGVLVAVTVTLVARRNGAYVKGGSRDRSLLVDPSLDPDELARQAEEAEAAGDLSAAVRLRYEEGLVRLVRAGRLVLRPETTASGVARVIGGEEIAALTATFERVVYGGERATVADVRAARSGWLSILGARAAR